MSELVMTEPRRPATPPVAVSSVTTEANRTGSWKYIRPVYRDRVAPCNAGCPVGTDTEGYLALLREGRIDEAADLLLRENPIPAITGRVCNHPCECHCNRAHFDGAVAIHAVERMLGDYILGTPLPQRVPVRHPERVAVIGSGPAGLAAAYHLARLGYAVEIFERDAEAGGMLRQGIPSYRLPRDILDRQIERITALGVEIHRDVAVGSELSWQELSERFAVLFVATGAHRGRPLGIAGEDLPGVRQGLEYLRTVNRGERVEVGRRVVVIGGGNTAMDCARTARRSGAQVTVLYRRTRAEMPAIPEEVDEAEREGVRLVFLAAPAAFEARRGRLAAVTCTRMRLGEPDASGRRRPVESDEPPFRVLADTALLATGEESELDGLPPQVLGRGAVAVDGWGASALPFLFAGGDAAGEERTVAYALGAGKRAAIGIDRMLRTRRGEEAPQPEAAELRFGPSGNLSMARWRDDDPVRRTSPVNEVVDFARINLSHFAPAPRHADHFRPRPGAPLDFAEVNLGLDTREALAEAARCFGCGVCNECELCMIFCGDLAIRRSSDGGRFEIALEYCKGCGICAAECPRGSITMTREGL
jgi:NADPH-dependent glutamate synthase beta subunit-like oxidoreductase